MEVCRMHSGCHENSALPSRTWRSFMKKISFASLYADGVLERPELYVRQKSWSLWNHEAALRSQRVLCWSLLIPTLSDWPEMSVRKEALHRQMLYIKAWTSVLSCILPHEVQALAIWDATRKVPDEDNYLYDFENLASLWKQLASGELKYDAVNGLGFRTSQNLAKRSNIFGLCIFIT